MTARCPQCQARYRIAREKIGPRGARLRCTRCETTFRVHAQPDAEAPEAAAQVERAAAGIAPSPAPQPARSAAAPAPRAPAAPAGPLARALVADADADRAKRIADYLSRWRIAADVAHDGREALVRIFRRAPELAVLGPRLPNLDAPALCEVVRRSADLAGLRLIRVCAPGEVAEAPAYDAHVTLEAGDLPAGLAAALERVRVGARPTPDAAAVAPAPQRATPPAPPPPPRAPAVPAAPAAAAGAGSAEDPAVAAALRLARIVVSDIVLYNPDKFAAAAAAGNAGRALAAELDEARAMFNQRVPENLRAGRDFLVEELERRARAARA